MNELINHIYIYIYIHNHMYQDRARQSVCPSGLRALPGRGCPVLLRGFQGCPRSATIRKTGGPRSPAPFSQPLRGQLSWPQSRAPFGTVFGVPALPLIEGQSHAPSPALCGRSPSTCGGTDWSRKIGHKRPAGTLGLPACRLWPGLGARRQGVGLCPRLGHGPPRERV